MRSQDHRRGSKVFNVTDQWDVVTADGEYIILELVVNAVLYTDSHIEAMELRS
jgi:hypothetical protein